MRWRLALVLATAAFLLTGIYGAWAYVHDYEVYRGFPPPSDPSGIPTGRMLEVQARMLAAYVRGEIPRYTGFVVR